MEYVLVTGVVGAIIGFFLGVLAMVFLVASRADELPTPRTCGYPHRECLVAQESSSRA
jgi:hypothetical protein